MNGLLTSTLELIQEIRGKSGVGSLAILFGLLSLLAPLLFGAKAVPLVGLLLIITGSLQLFYSFRRVSEHEQRSEASRGRLTLLAGLLIFCAPAMVGKAAALVTALLLAVRVVQNILSQVRSWKDGDLTAARLIQPLVGIGLVAVFLLLQELSARFIIGIGAAYWQFSTGWEIWSLPTRDLLEASQGKLPFPDDPQLKQLAQTLAEEERRRRLVDRSWIIAFLGVLFAIHIGRMQTDWDLVGTISPGVALLGDMAMALLIAFVFVIPARLTFSGLTRGVEPRLWRWASQHARGRLIERMLAKLAKFYLKRRLLFAIRLRQARYSLSGTLERGLQMGLPLVAVIVATTPIWGMSWYFDTENWAAGIWNSWAENRTLTWREAMVEAVSTAFPERTEFRVVPTGVENSKDFSFVVIGDTGEGDASQLILKHQLVLLGNQPRVKFLVLSSDVIYPSGEMKDYESKFFLPFSGFSKPIYAIPGNHDWYDALEGFAATFFRPDSARTAMRARIEVDRKLTTTRDSRIESLIGTARELHSEYEIETGFQDCPFFKFETEQFFLIAVDTGVAKRVDPAQFEWLEDGLEQAEGKFKMVILGHPLYAGGVYQAAKNEDFASIHALLRRHHVDLVMAGDTHDLEYYKEPVSAQRAIHHFVNGGGGAYLSFGTALDWPRKAATESWAFYPSRAAVIGKLDRLTPSWKLPFWLWTKHLRAWPFSAEALSALFDYNMAPFFQSFTEVRVEPSAGRVRVLPYGIHGPLTWRELEKSADLSADEEDRPVEFVLAMPG